MIKSNRLQWEEGSIYFLLGTGMMINFENDCVLVSVNGDDDGVRRATSSLGEPVLGTSRMARSKRQ